MSAEQCIAAVKEALGEEGTAKQLEDIFELLERRSKAVLRNDPSLTKEQALIAAAENLASEKKLAALIERRNEAINRVREAAIRNYLNEAKAQKRGWAEALRAMMVGEEGPWKNAGRSVDAVKHALEAELLGPMTAELERAGLLRVALLKDANFERNVAREMAILNGGKGAATGDLSAQKLAAIFVKYTESARVMQNKAGAFIRKMPGYVARQSHDQLKVAKAGFEAWRAKIAPLLDESTFDDAHDASEFLRMVYTNLASGNHMTAKGAADWMGGFKGSGNLAKRVSQERTLIFKDADSWLEYNNSFGRGSLFEVVVDNLGFAARNTALMRTFGTNPERMFDKLRADGIVKAKKETALGEIRALESPMMQAEFDQISGGVLQHGNPNAAAINGSIRSVISMAKLGGVLLSSLPDIALRASVLRHNGVNLLEGYGSTLTSLFDNFRGTAKREVADLLNAGTQGLLGSVYERFHATDSVPGSLTKLSSVFFKATGLTWWTDAHSRGMGVMLARNMALQIEAGRGFAQLDRLHQTTLSRYGIDDKAWEALRQAKLFDAEGQGYLTPDAVAALPDAVVLRFMGKSEAPKRAIDAARDDLKTSLGAYYTDQVREAMTFAGAKERALTTLGSSAGTPLGEAVRYIAQFKTFPITYVRKHLNREINRGETLNAAGLAHLVVATTALGYVSLTAKEYMKGRDPRDPQDAAGWAKLTLAAMQQGGGLGIYGDFLFSEANRFGGGIVGTLAGPAAGLFEQYVGVLQAARDGDDLRAKAVRAAVNSTPFANLFYARVGMDYLILNGVMESLNPGYLRRYQRKIEKENDQTFWLPPS